MHGKEYVKPDDLVRDSFALARRIHDSGYRPDVIVAMWRGGTPVGIVVHEFFLYKGIETYHTVIKADSYDGIERRREPRLERMDELLARLTPASRVLVVDDIFDSGRTLKAVRMALTGRTPHVRVAALYVRQGHNEAGFDPDYFLRVTDRWIVFPHELMGLTPEEIRAKDTFVYDLLA